MQKGTHIIIALHHSTLQAHPSVQSTAPPFRLTVLETGGLQHLHASRAGELDGRFRAPCAVFEIVVEAPPCFFAEWWGGSGDGVELVAYEAHVRDGGGLEVRCYLRYHLGWEAEEGRCRHLSHRV